MTWFLTHIALNAALIWSLSGSFVTELLMHPKPLIMPVNHVEAWSPVVYVVFQALCKWIKLDRTIYVKLPLRRASRTRTHKCPSFLQLSQCVCMCVCVCACVCVWCNRTQVAHKDCNISWQSAVRLSEPSPLANQHTPPQGDRRGPFSVCVCVRERLKLFKESLF